MLFENKKILITGGYGFVGSHLIKRLDQMSSNVEIICYDKMTYAANFSNLDKKTLKNKYTFIKADICNFDKLFSIAKKCDYIINCAAESHVDRSFKSSLQFLETNIIGSRNIYECSRLQTNIKKVIHISTDEVFGETLGKSAHENSKINPTNPYSASKACAEILGQTFIKSFNIPLTIIRGNNLYGNNQYPEKIIPYTCFSLAKKKKILLHGGGHVMRKFLHVNDFCNAVLVVLGNKKKQDIYNVGTLNKSIKIKNLVKKICEILNYDYEDNVTISKDRPFNDSRYSMNSSKIRSLKWTENEIFNSSLPIICKSYYEKYSK